MNLKYKEKSLLTFAKNIVVEKKADIFPSSLPNKNDVTTHTEAILFGVVVLSKLYATNTPQKALCRSCPMIAISLTMSIKKVPQSTLSMQQFISQIPLQLKSATKRFLCNTPLHSSLLQSAT